MTMNCATQQTVRMRPERELGLNRLVPGSGAPLGGGGSTVSAAGAAVPAAPATTGVGGLPFPLSSSFRGKDEVPDPSMHAAG